MKANNNRGIEFFAGLLLGGLIGAALAILLAPQSGEETRAQLREKSYDLSNTAGDSLADARYKAGDMAAEALNKAETQARDVFSQATQRGKSMVNDSSDDSKGDED